MQVLNNLQAFITDSVTTLHEHKVRPQAGRGAGRPRCWAEA